MTLEQLKQAIALVRLGWEPDDTDKLFQPGSYPTWTSPHGKRMTFGDAVKSTNEGVTAEIKKEVGKEVKKEVKKELKKEVGKEVKKEVEKQESIVVKTLLGRSQIKKTRGKKNA